MSACWWMWCAWLGFAVAPCWRARVETAGRAGVPVQQHVPQLRSDCSQEKPEKKSAAAAGAAGIAAGTTAALAATPKTVSVEQLRQLIAAKVQAKPGRWGTMLRGES